MHGQVTALVHVHGRKRVFLTIFILFDRLVTGIQNKISLNIVASVNTRVMVAVLVYNIPCITL